MEKKIIVLAVIITISILLSSSINIKADTGQINQIKKGEDFTHSVVLELFVTTWCQYCPSTEDEAVKLNYEYRSNFFFISMVCDVNDKADQRSRDYFVESYPTAIFDGGYRDERSGNADTFEGHIEDCGNRNDYAVDLEVRMEKGDGNNIDVGYTARYNDAFPPFFDCYLRVYIVEKVSRHVNNEDQQIPYGFLDYAFDKDLRLVTQTDQSESTTWDASDCDLDNLIVIGAIFDKSTGTERYSVQSASTEKYADITISNITQNPVQPTAKDEIDVIASINGTAESVELEYSYCIDDICSRPETKNMTLEGENYIGKMGPFKNTAEVHYKIIAKDSEGNEMESQLFNFTVEESSSDGGDDGIPGFDTVFLIGIFTVYAFIYKKKNKKNYKF